MKRETIMNSIALKKKFCKDCGIPIAVYDSPYFYERLQTIDRLFGCIKKFDIFCTELEKYANEQEYFAAYNSIKESIINAIKSKKDFIAFTEKSFETHSTYQKRNLYIDDNDGKTFISIDMKKANFSALCHYSKDIFDGCDTWEQFIGKFTSNKHIIESKYIRQVILGACNPKRQISYEKYLMGKLLDHIVNCFPNIKVFSLGEDEILFEVTGKCGFSFKELKDAVFNCPDGIGNLVRVEMFNLDKLNNSMGWVKNIYSFEKCSDDGDNIRFKCVDAEVFHQVVKKYFREPITDNDLVFYHNGRLSKFLQEVA